jgi:hypothetical protein
LASSVRFERVVNMVAAGKGALEQIVAKQAAVVDEVSTVGRTAY